MGAVPLTDFVRIKICGLSRLEDVAAVNETVPDYAGFVFAPSRRRVDAATARRLREELDGRIVPVGVFVDAPVAEVVALYETGIIALAQLHGGETDAYVAKLKAACGVPVIKAVCGESKQGELGELGEERGQGELGEEWGIDDAPPLANSYRHADFLLLDGAVPGSGQGFDWDGLGLTHRPYFLAGGIGLHNVEAALALGPYGIDVSSGVETAGRKDRGKIVEIVSAVRNLNERQG